MHDFRHSMTSAQHHCATEWHTALSNLLQSMENRLNALEHAVEELQGGDRVVEDIPPEPPNSPPPPPPLTGGPYRW